MSSLEHDTETSNSSVSTSATSSFALPVDTDGKATVLRLLSFKRPHMRAFHLAWFSFFLAYFVWFALTPLQHQILLDNPWLSIGTRFKTQNILAVAGTVFMRFVIGPVCDRFGPRLAQSLLLGLFSVPVFLVAAVRTY